VSVGKKESYLKYQNSIPATRFTSEGHSKIYRSTWCRRINV